MNQLNDPSFYLALPSDKNLQCEVYEGIKFVYGETQDDIVESFGVCLTPICYIHQKKADYIKFAQFIDIKTYLTESFESEIKTLENLERSERSKKVEKIKSRLKEVISNRIPRYYFLPQHSNLPDSLIDFQRIASLSLSTFKAKVKYASILSPYAEAILNRYCAYSMRIGTPDYFKNFENQILARFSE